MTEIHAAAFDTLLLNSTPLIDVRAPAEFNGGTIPGAVNLPLLTDSERARVGLIYKQQGQRAAIELGHCLVSGDIRLARTQAWTQFLCSAPEAVITCFRGGLRSQTVQQWLNEAGVQRPRIAGGTKALRLHLLRVLQEEVTRKNFFVVTGPTGSGKTRLLTRTKSPFVDLEDCAQHRGSAFGGRETPQPCQVNFENQIALQLLRLKTDSRTVLIEDESRMIGHCVVPLLLFEKMAKSPMIQLQVPLHQRVENIYDDYIRASRLGTHQDMDVLSGFESAVRTISKRLGGLRSQEILADLHRSREDLAQGRGLDSNRVWIEKLLKWYYDPLYEKGMQKRKPAVIFTGPSDAVLSDFLIHS